MTTIQASAPGKVVLSGEYAVLDGAPAIAMAVNRRAEITVAARSSDDIAIRSMGPGEHADTSVFDCVTDAAGFEYANDYSFMLDTSAFVDADSEVKLGIGSSAALTVALSQALISLQNNDRDVGEVAANAHRNFQQGVGSGVDIFFV